MRVSSCDSEAAASELAAHLARMAIGLSAAFAPEVDPEPMRRAVSLITRAERRKPTPAKR